MSNDLQVALAAAILLGTAAIGAALVIAVKRVGDAAVSLSLARLNNERARVGLQPLTLQQALARSRSDES